MNLSELGFHKTSGLREWMATGKEVDAKRDLMDAELMRRHFFTGPLRSGFAYLGQPNLIPITTNLRRENVDYYERMLNELKSRNRGIM